MLLMGGLIETQAATALKSLVQLDRQLAEEVIASESEVNRLEIEIDADCSSVIARRQPTARDLRFIITISRVTANLETAGDEAEKIAKQVCQIIEKNAAHPINYAELRVSGDMAIAQLHQALDAFTRLDAVAAATIVTQDKLIDEQFHGFMRKIVAYAMEDPRSMTLALDLIFIAKAIEHIGDNAKNIAKGIIYLVKGIDVRHASQEELQRTAYQ